MYKIIKIQRDMLLSIVQEIESNLEAYWDLECPICTMTKYVDHTNDCEIQIFKTNHKEFFKK